MHTALRIDAFQDEARTRLIGSFLCQIDPEHFDVTHAQNGNGFDESSVTAGLAHFREADREGLSFTFVIDATGAVEGSQPSSVAAEINRFKSLAYDYNGKIHAPNHLTVISGDHRLQGRLASLAISYTLFDQTGTPLRARLSVRIEEAFLPQDLATRSGLTSPDLSHAKYPPKR